MGLAFSSLTYAQKLPISVIGKWETPDKDVIEFYNDGSAIIARQVNTQTDKDKPYNGKIVAKELKPVSNTVFEGTVIDPKDNKQYNGKFILNNNGEELQLKVKWGFLSFNETWKRLK